MRSNVRARFWLESSIASLSGVLGLVTLFWRDWIEAITGFDPDHHNGSVEWLIVAVLLAIAVSLGAFARVEWHRSAPVLHSAR